MYGVVKTDEEGDESTALSANNTVSLDSVTLMALKSAFKKTLYFTAPLALGRVAVVVNNLGNGLVFTLLNTESAAAGAIITTIINACLAPTRNALQSETMMIVDRLSANRQDEIGGVVFKGWAVSLLYTLPIVGIFLSTGYFLRLINISDDIAQEVEHFLVPFSAAVFPILGSAADQFFAIGIKKPNINLVIGLVGVVLSMSISYPLAFGWLGLPKVGIAGLGIGAAVSAWLNLIILRLYYLFNKDFRPYHLFKAKFANNGSDLIKLLKVGIPIGLLSLIDWTDLFTLTLLSGVLGKNVLIAMEVSLQPICAYYLILQSLAQATSRLIADEVKILSTLANDNRTNKKLKEIVNTNIRRFAYCANIIGVTGSAVMCGLFVGIPKQLTEFFGTDSSNPNFNEILITAQAILLINGVGLLFDAPRNIAAGILRGFDDVIFAPLINFITMLVIGLSAGGVISLLLDWGANWLFITRDIGIILAAAGLVARWLFKSTQSVCSTQEFDVDGSQSSCFDSWCPLFCIQKTLSHASGASPANADQENQTFDSQSDIDLAH